MFLAPFPMLYTFRNSFVLREYVLMLMTSTTETILTSKLLKQGYRYHKLREALSNFHYSHSELIVKYNICLKLFCNKAYQNLYFIVI